MVYWFSVNWTDPHFVFRHFLPVASNEAAFGGTVFIRFFQAWQSSELSLRIKRDGRYITAAPTAIRRIEPVIPGRLYLYRACFRLTGLKHYHQIMH